MFPIITNIKQFEDILKNKEEINIIEHIVDNINIGVISYLVQFPTTFDSDMAKEARGITFRMDTGECICRPFHKFFNVNEREETQFESIQWENVLQTLEKMDGSMITPFMLNDIVYFKTKTSPFSSVVTRFNDWIKQQHFYNDFINFCKNYINKGYTPIFEYSSTDCRIVINYQIPTLKLIAIRHIKTGEYLDISLIKDFPTQLKIDEINVDTNMHDFFYDLHNNWENHEGVVVVMKNGERYKIKTLWYLNRHKIVTQLNHNVVYDLIVNQNKDDTISYANELKLTNIVNLLNESEELINNYYLYILHQSHIVYDLIKKEKDRKLVVENLSVMKLMLPHQGTFICDLALRLFTNEQDIKEKILVAMKDKPSYFLPYLREDLKQLFHKHKVRLSVPS